MEYATFLNASMIFEMSGMTINRYKYNVRWVTRVELGVLLTTADFKTEISIDLKLQIPNTLRKLNLTVFGKKY